MNTADIVILAIIALSALVGLFRGFIKEVFSLAAWLAALILAFLFGAKAGAILPLGTDPNPLLVQVAGGALVFVLVLILGGLLTHLISQLAKATGLSGTDRILGSVFGLFRGALIVLALLVFVPAIAPVSDADWWRESRLVPEFLAFEGWAMDLFRSLSEWISGFFTGPT